MPTTTRAPFSPLRTVMAASVSTLLALSVTLCAAGPLDREAAKLIDSTDLGGGIVAMQAIDLDSGEEIASYRAETAMIPASNMKLLTSGAALFVLGSEFTFKTRLVLDETSSPPVLIVRADGDPALGDPAIFIGEQPGVTLGTLFDQIAGALRGAGVTRLSHIIIDDRVFDRTYTHPCWPADQLNRWYCAQVGGLNFHANVISVFTEPSRAGTPAVRMEPDAHWVQMRVKAESNPDKRNTAWVARPTQSNSFTLYGNVRGKSEIQAAIDSPPEFAGRLLAEELSSRGIALGPDGSDALDSVSLIEPSDEITASRTIAVITTPLFDVLERTNTDSYNLYAEALLKRIGHEITSDPGSWENGATVIRMMLAEKLGPGAAETTVISDGSGMCRDNQVSPATLVAWLRALARSEDWGMFKDSLATPGSGTLRSRLDDGQLESEMYAKSGYLTGTYALSGVLIHPRSGQRVAFSILLNDVKAGASAQRAKPLIDELVEKIDELMAARAGSATFGG